MKAHEIKNGVVVNTLIVNSLDDFPNLVEATEGGIGWKYDGSKFTNPNHASKADLDALVAEESRQTRTSLLAETDFYALGDVTMSDAMKTYRQALRDLPTNKDWPDVTFPEKPKE